jgi:hypothetical protein
MRFAASALMLDKPMKSANATDKNLFMLYSKNKSCGP